MQAEEAHDWRLSICVLCADETWVSPLRRALLLDQPIARTRRSYRSTLKGAGIVCANKTFCSPQFVQWPCCNHCYRSSMDTAQRGLPFQNVYLSLQAHLCWNTWFTISWERLFLFQKHTFISLSWFPKRDDRYKPASISICLLFEVKVYIPQSHLFN